VIQTLVNWLIAYAKKQPYWHLDGYMERYWVLRGYDERPGAKPPVLPNLSARIHVILRSDDDRHFHDHPWNYTTVILRGGYYEVTPRYENGEIVGEKSKWYGPGSVLRRTAGHWHRLVVPYGKTATTLFIMGRKRNSWGFLTTPKFKTYYRNYGRTAEVARALGIITETE
jgi:hypothetical protein